MPPSAGHPSFNRDTRPVIVLATADSLSRKTVQTVASDISVQAVMTKYILLIPKFIRVAA